MVRIIPFLLSDENALNNYWFEVVWDTWPCARTHTDQFLVGAQVPISYSARSHRFIWCVPNTLNLSLSLCLSVSLSVSRPAVTRSVCFKEQIPGAAIMPTLYYANTRKILHTITHPQTWIHTRSLELKQELCLTLNNSHTRAPPYAGAFKVYNNNMLQNTHAHAHIWFKSSYLVFPMHCECMCMCVKIWLRHYCLCEAFHVLIELTQKRLQVLHFNERTLTWTKEIENNKVFFPLSILLFFHHLCHPSLCVSWPYWVF